MSHDISSIGEEATPFSGEAAELNFSLFCDKNQPRNGTDLFLLVPIFEYCIYFHE